MSRTKAEGAFFIACFVALLLVATAVTAIQAHMEARTFRKLTGRTDVTWWDAVWVNLRVDDD